jgi:hypothetical protein
MDSDYGWKIALKQAFHRAESDQTCKLQVLPLSGGRYGATESNPPLESLPKLLAELDDRTDDVEHGSVDLTHESEWNLGVSRDGYVTFENLEDAEPRHMKRRSPGKGNTTLGTARPTRFSSH